MWWSALVSERPRGPQEPGEHLDGLLRDLGLEHVDGLWCDQAHTVGVARSPGGLFIGWLDVGWIGPDEAFSEMRDVAHLVERMPRPALLRSLEVAVDEARQVRAERLRDCGRCGERFVPGQMYGASCCHSCAVRHGDTGR